MRAHSMSFDLSTAPVLTTASLGAIGIVAQLALPGIPDFKAFGDLFGIVFVTWYAWHTTSRTIPELVANFRDEQRLERERADKRIEDERADNREQLAAVTTDIKELATVVSRLVDKLGN